MHVVRCHSSSLSSGVMVARVFSVRNQVKSTKSSQDCEHDVLRPEALRRGSPSFACRGHSPGDPCLLESMACQRHPLGGWAEVARNGGHTRCPNNSCERPCQALSLPGRGALTFWCSCGPGSRTWWLHGTTRKGFLRLVVLTSNLLPSRSKTQALLTRDITLPVVQALQLSRPEACPGTIDFGCCEGHAA